MVSLRDMGDYDNALRLKEVHNQQGANTVSKHTYTLDAVGNRTQASEVLPQVGPTPAPIFSDGFESGGLSAFDGTFGSPQVVAEAARNGAYGLKLAAMGNTQHGVYKTVNRTANQVTAMRAWVKIVSHSAQGRTIEFEFREGSTIRGTAGFPDATSIYLYMNGLSSGEQFSPTLEVSPGWHEIEMVYDGTASPKRLYLLVDGVEVTSLTDATGAPVERVIWQNYPKGSSTNATAYFDDVAWSDSVMGGTPPRASASGYTYDRLYRLTSVAGARSATYGYDPAGNRSTKGSTAYSYDRADRITAAGAVSYTVNANGNLTARGTDTFGYDQANRLKTASVGGTSSSYVYDGDGKRASKTVGGTPTGYVYDVNASLPVLLDDGARKYVWGLGLAYAVDSSGGVLVYHADGLGSVRALTDVAGAVVQTHRYDEYGVVVSSGGSVTQPFQYTGEVSEPETGLLYLRARFEERHRPVPVGYYGHHYGGDDSDQPEIQMPVQFAE